MASLQRQNLRRKLSSSGGAKRLVLKNFALPTAEAEPALSDARWSMLSASVSAILESRAVTESLETLYRAVELACTGGGAQQLYAQLSKQLRKHQQHVRAKLLAAEEAGHAAALRHMDDAWRALCDETTFVRGIFIYLDRTYALQTPGVLPIWDLGLDHFREEVLREKVLHDRTVKGLLWLIGQERQGEVTDRAMIKRLIRMLSQLNLYADSFEAPFLSQSRAFYQAEGAEKVRTLEVPAYLCHVCTRLDEEVKRLLGYLDDSSHRPLIAVVEEQLLLAHMPDLLHRGVAPMMDGQRLGDLERFYALAQRVKAGDDLCAAFGKHVFLAGAALVQDVERDKEMVKNLLEFKARTDALVKGPFGGDVAFRQVLQRELERAINKRPNKPAELVAKYIDKMLRKSGVGDDELDRLFDNVLLIFRYINGKDVFEAFYKKALARRLLHGKSASQDAERAVLSKLKQQCGADFTQKLEGMFRDCTMGGDLSENFRRFAEGKAGLNLGLDLGVNVLTSGFWPTYPTVEVTLPAHMVRIQTAFTDYYQAQHKNRRLRWQNSLGDCTLSAAFPKGEKDLQVTLYMTLVLLLFNDAEKLTFTEIQTATNIEADECRRVLQALALGKTKILIKRPKGREVLDGDFFAVNDSFSNPRKRVKVMAIQFKETAAETKATQEEVEQDRVYLIDAAIVRIMKTRKSLKHAQLVSDCLAQLKFPVKLPVVKKCIESLIEREYLERDPDSAQTYRYLA